MRLRSLFFILTESNCRTISMQPQRSRGPKGSHRPQARYMPKADIVSSSDLPASGDRKVAPPLTTSLRESAAEKPQPVNKGDRGIGGSCFVRYLPQDEAVASGLGADAGGSDATESQAVVDFLNEELSRLLKMKPRDFWNEVAKNDSLHQFIDSYLQFRSRWYDFPHRGSRGLVAGVIVGEADLCRRVFLILYRISSNRDPGVRASDCLSAKDHTALLQENKLLNLPKLLDICAIYGHENGELTKSLVENAIKALPQFLNNCGAVVSHFLSIVHTMHERCNTSLEALSSSEGKGSQLFMQLSNDCLEVMDFINDSVMTFDAFAEAYKPAALHFSASFETSYGNDDLLNSLARLHDALIPSMLRGLSSLAPNAPSFQMLSGRMVGLGWKLLDFCYLNCEIFADDLFLFLPDASKVFPASVSDPCLRGDILVQTLKEISGYLGNFAEKIEMNYGVFNRISSLCRQGWISLDDEQLQYLSQILKPSSSPVDEGAVLLDSKISQIKDLFPDYGRGFLRACLEAYGQDPEEVIGRILEGTLREDLLSLDSSTEQIQPSDPITRKGKSILIEEEPSQHDLQKHQGDGGSGGRYIRKQMGDGDDAVMDSRLAKDAVRSSIMAAAAAFEYEDEYDDSFDDLGLGVGESGFEESENLGDDRAEDGDRGWDSKEKKKQPQFFVKDGKNYSYRIAGSVAVSSAGEAAAWNRTQKELIHGLGRGGNRALEAVKIRGDSRTDGDDEGDDDLRQQVAGTAEYSGRGSPGFRATGGRRGGGRNYRKDRAMKKHFSGLTGF